MSLIRKIEMFFLDRQETKLHIRCIKALLKRSVTRYNNDTNGKLFYIEEALRREEIQYAKEYEDNDGDDVTGRPIIRHFYKCPKCNHTVFPSQRYCSHCGQRLEFKR